MTLVMARGALRFTAGSPKLPHQLNPRKWTSLPSELRRLGIVRESDARLCDADSRLLGVRDELRQRVGLDDQVAVDERQELARRDGCAGVASAGEAQVLARPDDGDAGCRRQAVDGAVRASVVDEDDLDVDALRVEQRVDAPFEPRLVAVGEHDRRERRRGDAARIRRSGGIVSAG